MSKLETNLYVPCLNEGDDSRVKSEQPKQICMSGPGEGDYVRVNEPGEHPGRQQAHAQTT